MDMLEIAQPVFQIVISVFTVSVSLVARDVAYKKTEESQ